MNLKLFQVACCCFPSDFSGRQRTWCMLSRGLRTAHASLTANHRAIGSIRALSVMSRSPSPPHKRVKVDVAVEQAPVQALTMPVPATDTAPAAAGPSNASAPLKTKSRKHKNKKPPMPDPCSPDDVLYNDIRDFLGPERVDAAYAALDGGEWNVPQNIVQGEIIELRVGAFTVSGDSLSRVPPANEGEDEPLWAIVTPFAHPGDLIKARVYRSSRLHSYADLIQVVDANMEYRGGEGDRENGGTKGCKYFGVCGGCQFQTMPYPLQLLHKAKTVSLAYQRFSSLPATSVPEILPTIGSPEQWAYRTKITPHFDALPKRLREPAPDQSEEAEMNGQKEWEIRIGFDQKGRRGVLDIEECPIATDVLNAKMTTERKRVQDTIKSFKRGATLLLRDSLPPPADPTARFDPSTPVLPASEHVAITDHHAQVYERVGNFMFSFSAGSFFQNNNSILIPLTEYVREAIFPATPSTTVPPPTHLVDTYCGSGLFGITLSPYFQKIAGVEISAQSIDAARKNAEMNGITEEKATWLVGKAEDIFGGLPGYGFEGEQSCVVVDPPRKGCDEPFLKQLLEFKPQSIVYVSCNVHTQARDVGFLLNESAKATPDSKRYIMESLRGFDLFPQTAHVESVAVLRLV